ncbi:MAG: IS630 family transposase [Gallionella sp.]
MLAPFLGYLWSFSRLFIKAPSGRQRYNVLGALNALTLQLVTVTNDTYINAASVCELLNKIADLALKVPITLVLDNAKYQRCDLVLTCAKKLEIELLFLPTYSPNLNLIERLWKFVKKKSLYAKYYAKFSTFKSAIDLCLKKLDTDFKEELAQLMTLQFQTFKNVQIVGR